MKINKIFSQAALTIGTALAIVICPSERLLAQAETSIAPALPNDVAFTFSLSTKPETWQDLNRFHLFRELYLAASEDLPLPEGLNIQDDILSWLGDRSHVVVLARSGSGDPEAELEEKLLVVVPIKDSEKYAAYWQKFQSEDATITERTYRGVTIQEDRDTTSPDCKPADQNGSQRSPSEGSPQNPIAPASAPASAPQAKQLPTPSPDATSADPSEKPPSCVNFAAATVPGYAVYAISTTPIEAFIDAQVDATSMDPKLMRTLQRAEMPNSLVAFYADIPKFVDWVKAFAATQVFNPSPVEEDVAPQPPAQLAEPKQLAQTPASPQASPDAVPTPAPLPPEPEESDPASEYDPVAAIDRAFKPLLRDYDSIDLFVLTQPEGIRVKSSVYYKEVNPERADLETLGANGILRRVPGSTYTSINSRDLRQRWQEFLELSEGDKDLEAAADLLRTGFKASTGLDLEKDVLAWMDGEYAGFVFPTRKGLIANLDPTFQLGMGLMFQTSDRPAAEAAIRKLEDAVVFKFGEDFDIKRRTIADRTITSWEFASPYGDPSVMAYTWADADTLLITQGTELMVELLEPYGKVLPGYYTFNTATDSLPRPNQGYVYMNMGSVLALVNTMVPPFIRTDGDFQLVMRFLGTIRSFSATNSTTADRDQGDALVALAPVLPKQEAQVGQLAEKLRQRIGSFAP